MTVRTFSDAVAAVAPAKPAWADTVKVGDTLICLIDEWRRGKKDGFDGEVLSIDDDGVNVVYLSGYRSRNDHVPWEDIIARPCESEPYISLSPWGAPFRGQFEVFQPTPASVLTGAY